MVIEIILGVSAVANIALLIGVRNLLRQNEQLEDDLYKDLEDLFI